MNRAQVPTQHDRVSRRAFITGLARGAIGLGITPYVFNAFASSDLTLPFRKGSLPLYLHFNENSLGMSDKALLAAKQAVQQYGNRYADDLVDKLKQQLAQAHGVAVEQLILGNGSTEVIGAVIEQAVLDKATVVEPTPTFGDVSRRARARGLDVVQVPVTQNFVTDLRALKRQAETIKGRVLINICNPNNPTGTIADQSFLEHWVRHADKSHFFLIDEAYFEYAQGSAGYASLLPLIQEGQSNLVVTRTFSKIYGMAGMRIGYGFAEANTASALGRLAASFNLSVAGIAAAMASLEDEAFYQKSLQANQTSKQILIRALDDLGLGYVPSYTNFVLHRINGPLADYSNRMMQQGIKVGRRMTAEDGWNRISLGTAEEMTHFVKTLQAFRERGWV